MTVTYWMETDVPLNVRSKQAGPVTEATGFNMTSVLKFVEMASTLNFMNVTMETLNSETVAMMNVWSKLVGTAPMEQIKMQTLVGISLLRSITTLFRQITRYLHSGQTIRCSLLKTFLQETGWLKQLGLDQGMLLIGISRSFMIRETRFITEKLKS